MPGQKDNLEAERRMTVLKQEDCSQIGGLFSDRSLSSWIRSSSDAIPDDMTISLLTAPPESFPHGVVGSEHRQQKRFGALVVLLDAVHGLPGEI